MPPLCIYILERHNFMQKPKKTTAMKRGIKNILLSLVGFSAAPMLTACYGTPYDDYVPYEPFDRIEGFVVDTNLKPIDNIQVSANGHVDYTDENGHFSFSDAYFGDGELITAEDIDGEANGGFYGSQSVTATKDNHTNLSIIMSKK